MLINGDALYLNNDSHNKYRTCLLCFFIIKVNRDKVNHDNRM